MAIVVLSAISVILGMLWRSAEYRGRQASIIAQEISDVGQTNRTLQDSVASLKRDLAGAREYSKFWYDQTSRARQNQGMLLNEFEVSDLKQMGLEDPVNDLRRDLIKHPELIPYEGVLGGKMAFIEDSIALLSTRWVFAQFEDGHIEGRCLLSFEVGPGGQISWKILSAMLH